MNQVDERVEWLTAAMVELERVSTAAGGDHWFGYAAETIMFAPKGNPAGYGTRIDAGTAEVRRHILMNDPRSVRARVEADRRILAEMARWKHDYHDDDQWYSCGLAAATWGDDQSPGSDCSDDERSGKRCDCGLDHRRNVLLSALLSAYRYMPGFKEEWLSW